MAWPLSQDYNEAIQDPASCFADSELKAGRPVFSALGLPLPRSGNFADVYEFRGAGGARWALKCFTRHVSGLRERYSAISRHLARAQLPFVVNFKYLEQGIRIGGRWYPVVKMDWVDGFLLNQFVRDNLDKPRLLTRLSQIWLKMGERLREAQVAHGDLQHGNVILVAGSRSSSMAVKLIDYDGMWAPALADTPSGEAGHRAYQHPQRVAQGTYSPDVDQLPLLLVACALRALAWAGKPLWERYDTGDNLLFQEKDLRHPAESPLFKEVWRSSDAGVHDLAGYLALGLSGPLEEVPLAHDVAAEQYARPLSAAEEQLVTALLGSGTRVSRPVAVEQAMASAGAVLARPAANDAAAAAPAIIPVTAPAALPVATPAAPAALSVLWRPPPAVPKGPAAAEPEGEIHLSSPEKMARRKRHILLVTTIAVLFLALGAACHWILIAHPRLEDEEAPETLPSGFFQQATIWKGTITSWSGGGAKQQEDARMDILERRADYFRARITVGRDKHVWRVKGTVSGDRITWKALETIKEKNKAIRVDHQGTILGKRIELTFQGTGDNGEHTQGHYKLELARGAK
jgi:hypothetical protein